MWSMSHNFLCILLSAWKEEGKRTQGKTGLASLIWNSKIQIFLSVVCCCCCLIDYIGILVMILQGLVTLNILLFHGLMVYHFFPVKYLCENTTWVPSWRYLIMCMHIFQNLKTSQILLVPSISNKEQPVLTPGNLVYCGEGHGELHQACKDASSSEELDGGNPVVRREALITWFHLW